VTLGVASFPNIDELTANPYWVALRDSLERVGVSFDSSTSQTFGRRWLWANRHRIQVLHLHYIQQFYAHETTCARLRWVIRFARNLLWARALGYRTVFTLHNLMPTYSLKPAWVDYLGHWIAANFTDSVIVHCEFARKSLARKYGRRDGVYVVDHPHFIGIYPNILTKEEARTQLGLTADQTVFVFFGGIRPNKGIEDLITAFREVPGESLRLVIAGKPWPPSEYLSRLITLARQDHRIGIVAKYVPDEQIQIYLNASDIVTLPFASILTSSSTILAMSFARPVLVPSMGCLPELVRGDVGLLYDPHDPQALLLALQQSLEADLVSMGHRALERVSSLTWEGAMRFIVW
jgi:beta-1,4-mannosyltransferase